MGQNSWHSTALGSVDLFFLIFLGTPVWSSHFRLSWKGFPVIFFAHLMVCPAQNIWIVMNFLLEQWLHLQQAYHDMVSGDASYLSSIGGVRTCQLWWTTNRYLVTHFPLGIQIQDMRRIWDAGVRNRIPTWHELRWGLRGNPGSCRWTVSNTSARDPPSRLFPGGYPKHWLGRVVWNLGWLGAVDSRPNQHPETWKSTVRRKMMGSRVEHGWTEEFHVLACLKWYCSKYCKYMQIWYQDDLKAIKLYQ